MNPIAALVESLHPHGSQRVQCPLCSPERRKSTSKDLVITRSEDGWRFHCHHCNQHGFVSDRPVYTHTERKNVIPMHKPPVMGALEPQHYAWLQSRGISAMTADAAQLFAASKWFGRLNKEADCVGFPYFVKGMVVASKYRAIEGKDFTQDPGGAQTFWGIDKVDTSKPVIIVEGEIDALTAIECGYTNVLSVPSGAPMKVADGKVLASEDKKFSFVWDAFETLKAVPYITIATDTDAPGQALAEELARRIGKERCRVAKSSFKDLNEAFLQKGFDAVKDVIDQAEPYPVAGLSNASKFAERLEDLWGKGTGKGESTGYSNVDQIYTVAQGQLTVVTGYPSCGKSNFVDQLMVNLARSKDWKFALCSFENAPEIHISRLMEIYKEKRFFEGKNRMTDDEKNEAFKWVDDHFMFLDSEAVEPSSIDSILDRARIAVARTGIRGLVIDPYNYIENKGSTSETEFISNMLTRVQAFAKACGVHVWFVAHPSKITRSGMDLPRPDGMSISGSMAWWAKADVGLTVHRTKDHGVEIAVWKCRYRWVGTQGETTLEYRKGTGTYAEPSAF
ncbi:Archaeal primase DnaG/twinkle, TOPRIM domain [uncultured Caudovirales phage]|uniref:Archaeal primase DnaG/twinkle, TOPRIM domain n=1 Tax=uncultured Caudovirales phage TaxID=2100421 RepID=A0A6J5LKV3_9CAUD|nr:Archaeal primase DnaG/twinkle, TOPRIM domain [uncultured Caudovirales phage]